MLLRSKKLQSTKIETLAFEIGIRTFPAIQKRHHTANLSLRPGVRLAAISAMLAALIP